jgi:hypothetical protein
MDKKHENRTGQNQEAVKQLGDIRPQRRTLRRRQVSLISALTEMTEISSVYS